MGRAKKNAYSKQNIPEKQKINHPLPNTTTSAWKRKQNTKRKQFCFRCHVKCYNLLILLQQVASAMCLCVCAEESVDRGEAERLQTHNM